MQTLVFRCRFMCWIDDDNRIVLNLLDKRQVNFYLFLVAIADGGGGDLSIF